MARADLILSLINAGARGDQVQLHKTVEAMAAEERAKNHGILADRLLEQIDTKDKVLQQPSNFYSPQSTSSLFFESIPERRLEDLILPGEVEQIVHELIEEQFRSSLLRSYNLEPRNRILLAGPPGNGKTTLAESIAFALSVPFVVVRYDSVIGSYLGETAQRIGQVFAHVRSRQCVLFFDEFDSIGKERGDRHETGEIKRVVSSLLLHIDALPSYVVIVTASNHPELLDRAVWRRFQVRLELPNPKESQIAEWFHRFEKRTGHRMGLSGQQLAERLSGASFSEVEDFGNDILRRIVLSEPEADVAKITKQRLHHWAKRFGPDAMAEYAGE